MRIDIEQFLALTVALGTIGAVGTAVYISHLDAQDAVASSANVEEPEAEYPEAPDAPVKAPVQAPVATTPVQPLDPEPPPAVDVSSSTLPADEDLESVPGPSSEGAWMNG